MKYLVVLLLIFNSSFSMANAKEHITYIDFVMLEQEQRKEVIKMIQRYSSHTEYIQNYVLQLNSKKEKRTSYIDFFLNQFKAYAGQTAVSGPPKKSCFFGGWLSHMYVNRERANQGNDQAICANPARLTYDKENGETDENIFTSHVDAGTNFDSTTKPMAQESGNYYDSLQKEIKQNGKKVNKVIITPNEENGSFALSINSYTNTADGENTEENKCQTPRDIICNPMVYGRHEGGILCVPKKSSDAYNTSFLCEKALQHIKATSEDAYNRAMDAAVTEAIANQAVFNNTVVSMYDNCMCNGQGYENYTDQSYAGRVYQTRTCVAILNSTKNILNAIDRNNSCGEFTTSQLGEVSNMSLFFSRAYNHLNDVTLDMDAQSINAQSIVHFYHNRNTRSREESRISSVFGESFRELNQQRSETEPNSQVCPISMEENKEGQITVAGSPDLNSMTEVITISYKINNQPVILTSGDLTATIDNNGNDQSTFSDVDLSQIQFDSGNAILSVPIKVLRNQYGIRFTVNKDNTSDSADHSVSSPTFSCSFESQVSGGSTTITPTNNLALGQSSKENIDNITYSINIGGNSQALTPGQAIDLGCADASTVKVYASVPNFGDPVECNGEVVSPLALRLVTQKGDVDKTKFEQTINVKLLNGDEQVNLVSANPTAEQSQLSHRIDKSDLSVVSQNAKDDGSIDVVVKVLHDSNYKIFFNSSFNDQAAPEKEETVNMMPITCQLNAIRITPKTDTADGVVSLRLHVKNGDETLASSMNYDANIKYGDLELDPMVGGTPRSDGQVDYQITSDQVVADLELVGKIRVDGFGDSEITCTNEQTRDPVGPDPEPEEPTIAQCNVEAEITSDTDTQVTLKAKVKYKSSEEGAQEEIIESASALSDKGLSFKWQKRASASSTTETSTEDGVVPDGDGQAENTDRTPATVAGTDMTITVNKADVDMIYIASVEEDGDGGCRSNKETAVGKKSVTEEEEEEETELDNTINWQAPQAPGRAPRRIRRGLMFRGTR